MRFRTKAAVATILCLFGSLSAGAQSVEQFYQHKQIQLLVGSAPGGAYDAFARAIAAHMSFYIPGHPTFVIENKPGGGGLLTSNDLYNIAPRDGSEIGMVERGAALDPIVNSKLGNSKFDSRKFNWIGSPTREIGLALVGEPSDIKRPEDFTKYPLIVASIGRTDPTSVYPRVLDKLFGMKFKVVEGYPSSREALLAVDRGEAQGHISGASSGIMRAQIAPWLQAGTMKVIMQVGLNKDPAFPDAPLVTDFAKSPEQNQILELMFAQQLMAYPLLAPPGVPLDRVKALRAAFDETMKDPAFLADAARQNLNVNPFSGDEIAALLEKLYATPPDVIDRFSTLVNN